MAAPGATPRIGGDITGREGKGITPAVAIRAFHSKTDDIVRQAKPKKVGAPLHIQNPIVTTISTGMVAAIPQSATSSTGTVRLDWPSRDAAEHHALLPVRLLTTRQAQPACGRINLPDTVEPFILREVSLCGCGSVLAADNIPKRRVDDRSEMAIDLGEGRGSTSGGGRNTVLPRGRRGPPLNQSNLSTRPGSVGLSFAAHRAVDERQWTVLRPIGIVDS